MCNRRTKQKREWQSIQELFLRRHVCDPTTINTHEPTGKRMNRSHPQRTIILGKVLYKRFGLGTETTIRGSLLDSELSCFLGLLQTREETKGTNTLYMELYIANRQRLVRGRCSINDETVIWTLTSLVAGCHSSCRWIRTRTMPM